MNRLLAAKGLLRRNVSGGLALAVAAGLVGTIFGLGATGQAPEVVDGDAWLWSSTEGEVARVNSSSGGVDLRQPVADSQGHRVRVTQDDQFVFLHDLDTGRVTSVDLARMGFSGSLGIGTRDDVVAALSGGVAALVNRTTGLIRAVDPTTLQALGAPLQLPAPLVGGAAFDTSNTLWVGLPSQGTVVGLRITGGSVSVASTVPVAPPGHDLAVSALDSGVLAVDRGGTAIVAVVGDRVHRSTSPIPLTGALVPERTVGTLVAVTVPQAEAVVTVQDVDKNGPVGRLPLPKSDDAAPAVPFAGRVYVPDAQTHTVRVFGADGRPVGSITVPDADGPLELEVREQHLFVNAPDSSSASIVDQHGGVQVVEKHPLPPASPAPSGSAGADPANQSSAPPSTPPATPSGPAPPTAKTLPTPALTPDEPGPEDEPAPAPSAPPATPQPPGAPVPVTALAGDGAVSLTWGRAASGGAPVQQYTVVWTGGSRTVDGDTLSTVVTGLSNGTTYRFRVTARNRYGEGPPALSGPVTPVTGPPPAAPGRPSATADRNVVTVSWPAVADAREYVVTPRRAGVAGADPVQRVTGTTTEFAGLSLGKTYTFTVTAVDSAGRAGPASPASNEVVPRDAPTVVISGTTATATSVTVKLSVNTGGSPTTCHLTLTPSGKSADGCTTTTFTGLSGKTTYTVKVVATNALGSASASAKRTTSQTAWPGRVTCVDKPTNPNPRYCVKNGGIGVFTSPRYVEDGSHHRLKPGARINVVCRATGTKMYAYVYNKNKESNIWLKMNDGYWISWVWATLDNGDKVSAVPKCA
ncbi:fibronectin type III domain-containing protein [Dactylosporangium roseum]|uniref:Fibronectin type III domain-containing protein n=1 Tax=Dactylosporangium roseum TaxID=47989 RepID=A0ABY5YXG8_9ACTN|nr:fibronectin type III domain-containing protein [Dactylosporangium roseum]UWZ34448.1 fibronectin type III domain-containing protein [Dactylosporangium roseum]